MRIGIIGSTGISIDLLAKRYEFEKTQISGKAFKYYHGYVEDREIILTARNQYSGSVPPHLVDYKLIMEGMKELNVDTIVGTAMVGGLSLDIAPGTYFVLDQFLDFTKKSPSTVYGKDEFAFVDFAEPFCPVTRKYLIEACRESGVDFFPNGCYVGTDGPRYETSAEVRMFRMLGGDVVGMTNVTEAIFARELGMCYATIALVVNYGAGLDTEKEVTIRKIHENTIANIDHTTDILKHFIDIYKKEDCNCREKSNDIQRSNKT